MRITRMILVATALVVASARLAALEIAPGVELVAGAFVAGAQPDGNTVILRGVDGLVVVDSGRHVEHTRRIVEHARGAKVAVSWIVNTHWHLDHVGGNPLLRREFPAVRVLASDAIHGALEGFLANYRRQLEQLAAAAASDEAAQPFRSELAILDAAPALVPDETVTASGRRVLAGRALELHLESHAVTAGDLWILDTETGILIAGDLVTLPAPLLDTACPERWSQVLGRLAAVEFSTLLPGHGPAMDRAAFARYRAAFDDLLACAASASSARTCGDGWLAGAGELMPEADSRLARGLVDYYVTEVLRGDPGRRAGLCGGS